MDRLTDALSRRRLTPAVGLALAAIIWALAQPGGRSALPGRPVPTLRGHDPARQEALPEKTAPPRLLHRCDSGLRLANACDGSGAVLAAGFPGTEATIHVKSSETAASDAEPRRDDSQPQPAPPSGQEPASDPLLSVSQPANGGPGPELLDPTTPKDPAASSMLPNRLSDVGTPGPMANPVRPPDASAAPAGPERPADPPQPRTAPAEPPAGPSIAEPSGPGAMTPHTLPPSDGSLLLPSDEAGKRSEQLENVARQADRLIRRGFELAGREAYFAARTEFITALRLVAQGLDAEHQTTVHSRALAAGLTAMKEAEDFIPTGSRVEADLDLCGIIGSHRTPVLKNADTDTLTPLLALKCYFTFAQEQLAAAAGHEVAGSMGLHALGKLHGALARSKGLDSRAAEAKAVTFYQAALLVCPQNYLAANDLGVLLAQCGNYSDARTMLEHSLTIQRPASGWHNLAVVYQQLGESELARRANWQAEVLRRVEDARAQALKNRPAQPVRWVDPATFARTYVDTPTAPRPAAPESQNQPTSTSQPVPPTLAGKPPAAPSGARRSAASAPQPTTTSWWPWPVQKKGTENP